MGKLVAKLEGYFNVQGRAISFGLGVGIGVVSFIVAQLTQSDLPMALSLLTYFPFHIWMTLSVVLVFVSDRFRTRLTGAGRGPFEAFFARMLCPFGVFCLGWLFVLVLGLEEVPSKWHVRAALEMTATAPFPVEGRTT